MKEEEEEEDDDIVVGGELQTFKCPITTKTFEHPMQKYACALPRPPPPSPPAAGGPNATAARSHGEGAGRRPTRARLRTCGRPIQRNQTPPL